VGDRFRDQGWRLWHFAREILVRCPRCDGRALVAVHPDHRDRHAYAVGWLTAPHRLTCGGCGRVADWVPALDVLEAYVAAPLRERPVTAGSQTMLERLPAWMKAAGNREEVLAAIRSLRASS
ncbi:hypothetical protein JYK22_24015, partial [Nonomuraea sp. RK-328]|nr:hypothetical protein [Nonomuraea sp. RK-328]